MNLGILTSMLQAQEDQSAEVQYDLGYMVPTNFRSWRGVYAHLALGYRHSTYNDPDPTVGSLLHECLAADGKTFEGYKGGDYLMDKGTPVWVANDGESCYTRIVGITNYYGKVILLTGYMPEWD